MATTQTREKISLLKAWFLACRPRTLPISLPPMIVGTAMASHEVEHLNPLLSACALLCSLGIQIGTNLVNDAFDFKKGADAVGRLGPQRMTQEGLLSFNQVLVAAWLSFGFSLTCGIPLMLAGGWPLALILLLSIACGYLYTGGPFPLAYIGISDLFILMFFGWISTGTVYYLHTGKVDLFSLLAGTQLGLLAIVPHAINNLRDQVSDALVNKKTLAVRFGSRFARWQITFFLLFPSCYVFYGGRKGIYGWLFFLSLPFSLLFAMFAQYG